MRDIYSSCQRVVIWLGERDALSESALEGIEFMASRSHDGEPFNYYDWRKVRRGENSEGLLRYIPLRGLTETLTSAAALTSFFSRPWFTRVWVIQELTLSAHAIVVCGKFQIDWDRIVKADETSKTNFEHDLGTLKRFQNWPQTISRDIFNRMIMAWHKNATNPRDKIYGLMGLENVPPGESLIVVDYEAVLEHVFTQFTRAYHERTGNLQVLAVCRGCKATEPAEPRYPSWAVDYRFSKSRESLPESLISWGFDGWKAYPQGLSAGGHKQSKPSFVDNLLGLGGFQFDTVADISVIKAPAPYQIGGHPPQLELLTGSAIDFCHFYIEAKRMCEDANPDRTYRPTQQTSLEAFWQIIRGREIPIDHPETKASTRTLFEDVDRLLTRKSRREAPLGPIISLTLTAGREPRLMSFFAQVGLPKQRRFLITENVYMGLGPRETKVGDSIVILQGHRAPVVARYAASAHWRVVGESYIHGIMEGEAFHEEKCGLLWFE